MKNKILKISTTLALGATVALSAGLAFAENSGLSGDGSASSSRAQNLEDRVKLKLGNREQNIRTRGDREIDRRIKSLNEVLSRLQEMKKLSDSSKATLTSQIQTEIGALNTLKAKIDADTDLAILQADVKSILGSYRTFALIIPRIHLLATADRMATIADMMTAAGVKIQARITEAGAAGVDTTSMQASMTDFNAKIADAKVQYLAVSGLISALVPDNGDKTVVQANEKAMKDAREKIRLGTADLKDARKDFESIRKYLKAHAPVSTAGTTTNSQ